MDDDLPSTFDVVVIGTGLTESIVSAAAARNGHSVLHIDPREYYGGKWATFSWNDWTTGSFTEKPKTFSTNIDHENDIIWTNDIREFEQIWYTEDDNMKEDVSKSSRKFNIDLFPKVLMAREAMIQILIQSNVSRYLEFKCITKLMSSLPVPNNHIIESIPISKSDIFTTKAISLVEKRSLMKFIEFVLKSVPSVKSSCDLNTPNSSEPKPEDSQTPKTFEELAKLHKISPKLEHFIQSAVRTMDDCSTIAMKGHGDDCNFNSDFTERCRLFLESIGRYGNQTPFLWTLYGISEICQAFCRLSAIYGGIFVLKRPIDSVTEEIETNMINIKTAGKEIKTKYLVLSSELRLKQAIKENNLKCRQGITLVRGFMLVTGPRLSADLGDDGNLIVYKLDDADVIELDDTSLATTKNYRLLQVTCPFLRPDLDRSSVNNAESNLSTARSIIESKLKQFVEFSASKPIDTTGPPLPMDVDDSNPVEISANSDKPLVLYGSYFFLDCFEDTDLLDHTNIFSCATSSTELIDHLKKAQQVFDKMYPGEEFLPKAPDAPELPIPDEDFDDPSANANVVSNGAGDDDNMAVENEEVPAANLEVGVEVERINQIINEDNSR